MEMCNLHKSVHIGKSRFTIAVNGEEARLKDILIRFLIGGLVVSAFAAFGDMFKPKSFAGLFGAAPSVALATLGLTIASQGKLYAAQHDCGCACVFPVRSKL